jgi:hypothetical protein
VDGKALFKDEYLEQFVIKPFDNYFGLQSHLSGNILCIEDIKSFDVSKVPEPQVFFKMYEDVILNEGVISIDKKTKITLDLHEYTHKMIRLVKWHSGGISIEYEIKRILLPKADILLDLLLIWYKQFKELQPLFSEGDLLSNAEKKVLEYSSNNIKVDLVALLLSIDGSNLENVLSATTSPLYKLELFVLLYEYTDFQRNHFDSFLNEIRSIAAVPDNLDAFLLNLMNHFEFKQDHDYIDLMITMLDLVDRNPHFLKCFTQINRIPSDNVVVRKLVLLILKEWHLVVEDSVLSKLERRVIQQFKEIRLQATETLRFYEDMIVVLDYNINKIELLHRLLTAEMLKTFLKLICSKLEVTVKIDISNDSLMSDDVIERAYGRYSCGVPDLRKIEFLISSIEGKFEIVDLDLLVSLYKMYFGFALTDYSSFFKTISSELAENIDAKQIGQSINDDKFSDDLFTQLFGYFLNHEGCPLHAKIVIYLCEYVPMLSNCDNEGNWMKQLILFKLCEKKEIKYDLEVLLTKTNRIDDLYLLNGIFETSALQTRFDKVDLIFERLVRGNLDVKMWNEMSIIALYLIGNNNWVLLENMDLIGYFSGIIQQSSGIELYRGIRLLQKILYHLFDFYDRISLMRPGYVEDIYDAFYGRLVSAIENEKLNVIQGIIPLCSTLPQTFTTPNDVMLYAKALTKYQDNKPVICGLYRLIRQSIEAEEYRFKNDETSCDLTTLIDYLLNTETCNGKYIAMMIILDSISYQVESVSIIQWLKNTYRVQISTFMNGLVEDMRSFGKVNLSKLDIWNLNIECKIFRSH